MTDPLKPSSEAGGESASASPSKGRWLRWTAIGIAVVLLVPLTLLGAAALLLPRELIARVAAERAEKALGVPVAIGDLDLDFWPSPAVALQSARVGPDGAPVAAVDRILLRPRILPLFSGNVIVREIAIERPDIHLVVDSTGALNLPFGSGDEKESAPSTTDIEFSIDEFRIHDGRLRYTDQRDGTDVSIHGLEQTLHLEGRVAEGSLARIGLSGSLSSDSVDAELPGRLAAPLRGVRFAIDHDAELDRQADRLELAKLRLELQRLVLSGSGRILSVSDSLARRAELELGAEEFSFEDLARSLPEGFLAQLLANRTAEAGTEADSVSGARPSPVEFGYGGRASIAARVSGPLTPDTLPRVEGVVELRDVSVSRDGVALLARTGGQVEFSNEAVAAEGVTGSLFGEPFSLALRVNDLAAPVVDFAARGTAPVEDLLAMAESEEPIQASGALPFDLRGRLRPSDPAQSTLEGTISIGGVRAALPSIQQPIQVSSGTVRFAGEEVRIEQAALAFGESRVNLAATVREWLPVALGDTSAIAMVDFDARAGVLDLDALLGPSESEYTPLLFARLADRSINGKSAAEVAEELGISLPELPRLRARGSVTADRLVRNGLVYENLEANLESSPSAISAPRLRFGFMGGTVELGLALERGEQDATLVAVYHLENVGAGDFFSRFTPFQGHLSGLLTVDGDASLQLDEHMLPVRPTVRSSGQLALTSGALTNWPLLARVGERLGLQSFDTLAFREWAGEYLIAGPLVTLERAVQVSPGVNTELAGSFDFGGKLDLGLVANLSPELASAASEQVRSAAAALAGQQGRVPIGLRITGNVTEPAIALDLTAARDQALAVARQRATEEAQSAAKRAAAEVAERVLGDSVPVAPEQIGAAVRERVQGQIRGLFGGLGRARAPAAAEDSTNAPEAAPADSAAPSDTVAPG